MIFKYAAYNPVKRGLTGEAVLDKLPAELQNELIERDRLSGYVSVDLSKEDVVKEIDRILRIPRTRKIVKYIIAEVSQDDLDSFTHYQILVEFFYQYADFKARYEPPTCVEPCPFGSMLEPPFVFHKKKPLKFDIGLMACTRVFEKYLMFSDDLKTRIESAGLTGLDFFECEVTAKGQTEKKMWCSEIAGGSNMLADAVKIKTWFCKKHRIPNNFHAFSWRYDVDGFLDKDFQLITGLKVGRRQYVRRMPLIVVSRKALRVLLDGRCKGLTKEGFFLKESFTPCL